MKTILIAFDGSPHAQRALGFAADLASLYKAELLIVHVVADVRVSDDEQTMVENEYAEELAARTPQPPLALSSEGVALPSDLVSEPLEITTAAQNILSERMLERAGAVARDHGVREVSIRSTPGDPASQILTVARESHAEAIVLGSRGLGQLPALLLGSVSTKVAQLSPCNVVIVK